MSLKYVSRQDKWIKDGLTNIIGINASRKTLARSFLNFGKIDLYAYKLLKENSPSLAIFHLQQAAEKLAKAMLILDMNDINYNDLKNHNFICVLETIIRKHNQKLRDINNLENAMFRQALTFASPKFLDFLKLDSVENRMIYSKQIEKDIELQNEIVNLRAREKSDSVKDDEKSKLNGLIEQKERKLLNSGLLTDMIKDERVKKKILYMNSKKIKSFITQDKDDPSPYIFSDISRWVLLPFFNILFLTVITYPYETLTRYPDKDGSNQDYSNIEIFQASKDIYKRLYEITNQLKNIISPVYI